MKRVLGTSVGLTAAFFVCASLPALAAKVPGYALHPERGIGSVQIGESKSRVERSLDHRTPRCGRDCLRTYSSRRGDLQVHYIGRRVNGIESQSPQITLDGLRVGLGPKRLHTVLRHWRYASCQGYEFGSGPSTSIGFGRHGSVNVDVFSESIGGCGGP